MRWLTTLERRFGSLAIPGLIRVIVTLNALAFVAIKLNPEVLGLLTLRPEKVLAGEVWRLVTFIFIPRVALGSQVSYFWIFFYLWLLWVMGEGLEQAWGSFKLNLFYVFGIVGTAVAVLALGATDTTGVWLNMSLLFAFATLFPNFPIMLFFVLPVPVKWIALVSFATVVLGFVEADLSTRVAIVVAFTNYILFFGREWVHLWREQGRTMKRRQQFQVAQNTAVDETLHHCKICGSTEESAPEKEFRVAADGEEYCTFHLPSRQSEGAAPPLPESATAEKK